MPRQIGDFFRPIATNKMTVLKSRDIFEGIANRLGRKKVLVSGSLMRLSEICEVSSVFAILALDFAEGINSSSNLIVFIPFTLTQKMDVL
ncbi:hypothetical protein NP7_01220 [Moraxella osloensis]|uniref:Uncharacterized protein n=1 Tax=Faucicola osloensis TaxID=34062 RepID=A0A2D2LSK9_FAUOS|nr:hypothetical protein NP7_01220 [Moraxella osloensis]